MNDRERAPEQGERKLVDSLEHFIETVVRDLRHGSDALNAIERMNAKEDLVQTLRQGLTP